MTGLIAAIAIYIGVFGLDYLFYRLNPNRYRYVSRRTFLLFLAGVVAIFSIFWETYKLFFCNYFSEFAYITGFLVVMVLFGWAVSREKTGLCNTSSRNERCLTPAYVFIKSIDITFQQLTYLIIALALFDVVGAHYYTYIFYTLLLLAIHTPIVLSVDKQTLYILTFGLAILSAPIFYIYTELQLFWPAVYLHSLLYFFYWITFAEWKENKSSST